MARSDDLAPLLAAPAPAAIGYRQGVVVAWNTVTFANQIQVGESIVTNLPVLVSADAALIAPGDVVSILTFGGSWGILGRFTVPS